MYKLAIVLLTCSSALFGQGATPNAEAILDRYIQATGGRAAYEKIQNQVEHGTLQLSANGIGGTITIYQAAPNKDLSIIEIQGIGKIQSGSNGEVAWESSAIQGPRVKQGEERIDALRDATFNAPLYWRTLYAKTEVTGSENANGHDCYKVVLTPKDGKPVTQYYDKKSGLLVKSTAVRTTAMGDLAAEVLLDDYRKDGDLLNPHKVINKAAGQEFQITVQSVEYNVDLPANRFDLPDEIKALAQKPVLASAKPAPANPAPQASTAKPSAGGKLTLYMGGKPLASETYTIDHSNGKVTLDGSGNAIIGTMKVDIEKFQVVMDDSYHPLSAEARAKLGQIPMAITTTFADGKASSQVNGKPREDSVHPDAIVVNSTLPLYAWSILALRASFDSRDPQQFPAYIIGNSEVPGTVVYKGRETVEFAGKTAELNHLTATATPPQGSATTLDLWVDDSRKIIKILAPSQNVEAYQDSYDPQPQPAASDSAKPN